MVIAIEYMSAFFVGPPLLRPNLSGSNTSGGDQRGVALVNEGALVVSGVDAVDSRSAATLVSPTSARQA